MIDRRDFASVTSAAQAGALQSFWPIIIQTNGIALFTEIEININPCDAIWMPTVYDITCGKNPAQPPAQLPPGYTQPPYYVPDPIVTSGNLEAGVGSNIADVYQNGQLVQSAPVFSLRINSPNNPWLLFGLSTQIGTAYASATAPFLISGQGGCMRSITGPISRLWAKFYKFANWIALPTSPTGKAIPPQVGSSVDTVVLMSSLGFMQQTIERVQTWDDENGAGSPTMAAWSQTIASGGYQTPQLNSADKVLLGVTE
jgi:hypothetical protein